MNIGSASDPVYVGIDLAADASRTGVAVMQEQPDQQRLVVEEASLGADDDALVDLAAEAAKTGVDVPLGWPQSFVEHVRSHAAGALTGLKDSDLEWRRSKVMRGTDMLVREQFGLTPLSVAADRIAYPALRWTVVEARLRDGGTDCSRDGSGRICEVYPAAALRAWGLPHRGYKAAASHAARQQIVDGLDVVFPHLVWNGFREKCVTSDDVLDAVIAALVTREADAGRTRAPDHAEREAALSEGWIHVPTQ